MSNLATRTPDLEARARQGDLDAIDDLAEHVDENDVDVSDKIACYPLTVAMSRHPEWLETWNVELKNPTEEQMPFLGWVGRLGFSSWQFDAGGHGEKDQGFARSRDAAIAKLMERAGLFATK